MVNTNVLIIDNDITFSQQLSNLLNSKQFLVEHCTESEQGLAKVRQQNFQLILLSVGMPNLSGLVVLDRLRRDCDTPVMMLCHSYEEESRLEGYRKGADDYLSKSFSFTEIMLRIHTLLRRTLHNRLNSSQEIKSAGLLLNKRTLSVVYNQQDIILTPIQFRLLWTLVESRNQVLTKSYLYQKVLDRTFNQYDRTLDMHLSRIRKRLVSIGMQKECLKTVHGKGYLFS